MITGHLRGGHGLAIHRSDCPTVQRQRAKDPERWIDVQWAEEVSGVFHCVIEVLMQDKRGALARVAAELAASEANIVHIVMDEEATDSGFLKFTLQLKGRVHLAQVMRALRRLPEVTRIVRQ
jgi:(p)ppGpp synthase/HD superfamily hydrolase